MNAALLYGKIKTSFVMLRTSSHGFMLIYIRMFYMHATGVWCRNISQRKNIILREHDVIGVRVHGFGDEEGPGRGSSSGRVSVVIYNKHWLLRTSDTF